MLLLYFVFVFTVYCMRFLLDKVGALTGYYISVLSVLRPRGGQSIFLKQFKNCTYKVRKIEATYQENLLQLKWLLYVLGILGLEI